MEDNLENQNDKIIVPSNKIGGEVDLLAQLQAETNYKPETSVFEMPSTKDIIANAGDDFDANLIDEDVPPTDEVPGEGEGVGATAVKMKNLSNLILFGIDKLNELVLPKIYTQSLSKEDFDVMRESIRRKKLGIEDENPVVLIDYEEYVTSLPLEKDERKELKELLELNLQDANVSASPMTGLIICLLIIFTPKILPIIMNFLNKKTPAQKQVEQYEEILKTEK